MFVTKKFTLVVLAVVVLSLAGTANAQQPSGQSTTLLLDPQERADPAGQQAAQDARRTARRWGIGVHGGVGIDPEIIDVGAHGTVGPIFSPNLSFRPGLEIGAGEITTFLAINLDMIYAFPGERPNGWYPYVGAGPTFGLSHRGFATADVDNVDSEGNDGGNRFDFSDTDFNGGMNFVVGMRKSSGIFFEMKATAWGVSNIRLVAGFNF
jgi:hypothetical protein